MYSDEFVKAQLAIGNLPTTTNTDEFLDTADQPRVRRSTSTTWSPRRPSFQLSWDQAYPQEPAPHLHKAIQQFFNGSIDADGFIKAMQALPTD